MGAINPFTDFGFKKIFGEEASQKAFERAKEANLTKEEKDAYEESLKSYRDNINVIDTARKEGREEGREEGQKAKAFEVAKKMWSTGMSLEDIQELTGLSQEEVAELRI